MWAVQRAGDGEPASRPAALRAAPLRRPGATPRGQLGVRTASRCMGWRSLHTRRDSVAEASLHKLRGWPAPPHVTNPCALETRRHTYAQAFSAPSHSRSSRSASPTCRHTALTSRTAASLPATPRPPDRRSCGSARRAASLAWIHGVTAHQPTQHRVPERRDERRRDERAFGRSCAATEQHHRRKPWQKLANTCSYGSTTSQGAWRGSSVPCC
jgi:hypothetical protein